MATIVIGSSDLRRSRLSESIIYRLPPQTFEVVRRVEIEVRIGYKEDLDRALDILRDLLANNERVLKKPEPLIFVSELADSWIEIAVRPWTRNANWWPLLTELPRLVRLRFAEEGIEIPIPRREINMPAGHLDDSSKPDAD